MTIFKNRIHTSTVSGSPLLYPLTNEYLFRAVFQASPKALEGLCRALLRLSFEDTVQITIQNPIELGSKTEEKDLALHLSVLINNTMSLRLILQLALDHFCTEYALLTACRNFEHLYSGNNYETIEPVFHITFLNYSLFPEYPEFYSSYQLMNISNPACCCTYSDKLLLSIIDLSQTSKAVKEDKDYDIDLWARLLTASTWRELEVLEQTNDYLQAAVESLRQFMEDEIICQQCYLRENAAHLERLRHKKIKELDEGLLLTQEELQLAQGELRQTQGELKLAQDLLRQKEEEVVRLRAELATFQQ